MGESTISLIFTFTQSYRLLGEFDIHCNYIANLTFCEINRNAAAPDPQGFARPASTNNSGDPASNPPHSALPPEAETIPQISSPASGGGSGDDFAPNSRTTVSVPGTAVAQHSPEVSLQGQSSVDNGVNPAARLPPQADIDLENSEAVIGPSHGLTLDSGIETACDDESEAITLKEDYTDSGLRPEQIDSMLREEGYPSHRGALHGSVTRFC